MTVAWVPISPNGPLVDDHFFQNFLGFVVCVCFQVCKLGYGGYDMFTYHGPPKPTVLEVFMVNNLVFRWPKPYFSCFWGLMVRECWSFMDLTDGFAVVKMRMEKVIQK